MKLETAVGKAAIDAGPSDIEGFTIVFDSDLNATTILMNFAYRLIERGIPISLWFKPGTEQAKRFGLARIGPLRKAILGNKSSLLPQLATTGSYVFVIKRSFFERFLPQGIVIKDFEQLLSAYVNLNTYDSGVWKDFIAFSDVTAMGKVQAFILNDCGICSSV